MKRIGITGGIGSGKSVVSHLLRVMGYAVYDSDSEARRLMESSPDIRRQIEIAFGSDTYENDQLNRPLLAQRVFGFPEQIARLNAIVHPVVCRDFEQWSLRQTGKCCFVESAILYEAHLDAWVDEVWLVVAPESLRITRVKQRNDLSDREVRERMKAQSSEAWLRQQATSIIENDDKVSLIRSVFALLNGQI